MEECDGLFPINPMERTLLDGLASEWTDMKYSDVTIVVFGGPGEETRLIKTHKLVLASLSPMLREALLSSVSDDAVIFVDDLNSDTVETVLSRFYTKGNNDENYLINDENDERIRNVIDTFHFRISVEEIFLDALSSKEEEDEQAEDFITLETLLMDDNRDKVMALPSSSPPSPFPPPPPPLPPSTPSSPSSSSSSKRKRSAIWNYFSPSDKLRNKCDSCLQYVSGKGQNTSTMIQHLKIHHADLYAEYQRSNDDRSSIGRKKRGKFKIVLNNMTKKEDDLKLLQDKLKEDPDFQNTRRCPQCFKEFSGKGAMQHHWRAVHSGIKPFLCELCNTSFSRVDTFKAHVGSVHSTDRPFLCSVCGKTFSRRNVRDMHERVHKEDRRYGCSYCNKRFFTNQQKKNHERTHTGEKPFQCNECDRSFAMMHQLTTHMRVHTGDRPYECHYCSETFRYISSRNKHTCEAMNAKIMEEEETKTILTIEEATLKD